MNWNNIALSILSINTLYGCAFDPQPLQIDPPIPPEPSDVVSVARVKWGGDGRSVESSTDVGRQVLKGGSPQEFRLGHPVTIPVDVPDAIAMEVALPIADSSQPIQLVAEATLNAEEGAPKGLIVENLEASKSDVGTVIRFTLTGLRDVLGTSDRENRAFVKITLSNADSDLLLGVLRLIVATPPSDVELTGLKASELPDPALRPLLKLENMRMRLDLVQVFRLKNLSPHPVEIALPLTPSGAVQTHFHRFNLHQQMCSYSVTREDWDEIFSEQLYALPLTPEIKETFEPFINAGMDERLLRLTLLSGETRWVGIFGYGTKVPDLMNLPRAHSIPSPTSVVKDCRSVCVGQLHQGSGYAEYWGARGWPGHSRLCWDAYKCLPAYQDREHQLCNTCMEWESQFPISMLERKCSERRDRPGVNPWQVERFTETATVGTQTYPVKLHLEGAAAVLKLRTAYLPAAEDPETRVVPFPQTSFVVLE